MKRGADPPRLRNLLRDRADPLALALGEMDEEKPSPEELRRVAKGVRLALGIPLGSGHGGGAGGGSGAAGGAGAAGAGAAGGAKTGAGVSSLAGALKGATAGAPLVSSFVLPLAAGAVTAGAVLVTVTQLTPAKNTPAPPNIAAPAVTRAPLPAFADKVAALPPTTPAPEKDSDRHLAPTPAAPTVFRSPARSIASSPVASGSAEWTPPEEGAPQSTELDLVNHAQEELARDPAGALDLAREHERRFPLGMLAQEREVVAIDALLRLGRRREAESRALRFHNQYPQSAYGRRIDVLLQSAAP